jgi:Putative lumazine-binding
VDAIGFANLQERQCRRQPWASSAAQQNSSTRDTDAVRRAALDYVEGFYEGDTAKLVRALRPEMYKYGFWRDSATSPYRGSQMTFAQALAYANRVKTRNTPAPASAPKVVHVLDVMRLRHAEQVGAPPGVATSPRQALHA